MIDTAILTALAALKATLPARRNRTSRDERFSQAQRVASCERKKPFANRMDAESRRGKLLQTIAVEIRQGTRPVASTGPVAVYSCTICGHWHLTGVPQ